jgi:pimeloyl-ACP methyl ester carboxylesterase
MSATERRPAGAAPSGPRPDTTFGPLRQVTAGLLNVGYAEAGPAGGRAVVLLHGWPYDIHSFAEVTPLLASAGYRVIVPYLRGYGTTRFVPAERCATASSRSWRSTPSP